MGWTVRLEDDRRILISSLSGEFGGDDYFEEKYKMLSRIDPFGDTRFTRMHMPDLITDLKKLKLIDKNALIDELIALAVKCKDGEQLYICFYGD